MKIIFAIVLFVATVGYADWFQIDPPNSGTIPGMESTIEAGAWYPPEGYKFSIREYSYSPSAQNMYGMMDVVWPDGVQKSDLWFCFYTDGVERFSMDTEELLLLLGIMDAQPIEERYPEHWILEHYQTEEPEETGDASWENIEIAVYFMAGCILSLHYARTGL